MTIGITTNKLGKQVFLEHAFMGSPTTSLASQFKIGSGQVLLDENAEDLTTPVAFTGVDMLKDFTSGFPTISVVSTPEVTINCRVSANEAVGENLNTMAIFNTDATPKIMIQMNYTEESKSATDEFVFIVRNRVL